MKTLPHRRALLAMAAMLTLALGGISSAQGVPDPQATPGPCGPAWATVPTPNLGDQDNELVATAATSSSDVWAVGYYRVDPDVTQTLIEHWDGSDWSVIPSPNVPDVANYLTAVTALSPTDAWAVGYSEDQSGFVTGPAHTLTLHWDGTAWTIVASPNAADEADNYLQGVKAMSASDVWAVGYGDLGTVGIHWDGTTWRLVPTPNPGSPQQALYAVDGTATDDLWAVGFWYEQQDPINAYQPLFAHWDGVAWSAYEYPGISESDLALGVVALSSNDVWSVGTTGSLQDAFALFSQHWDGIDWEADAEPLSVGYPNLFSSVTALSPADLWAAGYYTDSETGATRNLVEHWDGLSYFWTIDDTPNIGAGDNKLGGIVALPEVPEVWAVGSYTDEATGVLRTLAIQNCPIILGNGGFAPRRAAVSHPGSTTHWMVLGDETHRIVDGTGLQLFDSGLRDPPGSFVHNFFASGTYSVVDQGTGSTMTVKVPVEAFPRRAGISTEFLITWGSHKTGGDRVYDVQVRRPGAPSFEDWKVGEQRARGEFLPDAGPGIYSFRARLRNERTGAAADYSAPVSIQVI